MTEPMTTCLVCERTRSPLAHPRADDKVTASKNWLRRTCRSSMLGKPCMFMYRAGLAPASRVTGQ